MNLGELVVQLGVKADTFTVKDFSKAIGDIPFSVASALTSIAGLSFGFVEMTKNVLDMTTGFRVFTAETGMNTRSLQQWQMVAKQAGLPGDIVTGAMSSLTSMMAQMSLGHGLPSAAAQAFGLLGFKGSDFNLNSADMLNKIQSGVMGKNPRQATELLKALGISPDMMAVFKTPASERERLTPTMSQGEIDQMAGFQKELAIFNQAALKEFVEALHQIEPYMADLTKAMVDIIHIGGQAAGGTLGFLKMLFGNDPMVEKWIESTSNESFEKYKRTHTATGALKSDVNVTNHIYGVSDPEAAGKAAAHEVTRAHHRKAAVDQQISR